MLRFLILLFSVSPLLMPAQEIERRLILIGDAGEINAKQEILLRVASELILPGKTIAYFLGDNIYPTGMELKPNDQNSYIPILRSQFLPFRQHGVPVYFMAGNHDWDKSGPNGLAKVKAQQSYINSLKDSGLQFVPDAGEIEPFVELITDSVVTIVYDSEYWLFPHPDTLYDVIDQKKTQFLKALDSIKGAHVEKRFLILSHHPMRSYGEHGLHFSLRDHIFPLRKIWKGLYLPLPVLGSAYPLLRSTIFKTAEDLRHRTYRALIDSVTDVFSNHPRVTYIAGHDHGLQLIQEKNFMQIVSGSGAKSSYIRGAPNLHYRSGKQGFVVLDILINMELVISYYVVENGIVRKDFENIK